MDTNCYSLEQLTRSKLADLRAQGARWAALSSAGVERRGPRTLARALIGTGRRLSRRVHVRRASAAAPQPARLA